MKPVVRMVKQTLAHFGYQLCPYPKHQVIPGNVPDAELYSGPEDYSRLYRPWLGAQYDRIFAPEVLQNTMLSRKKLYYLAQFLKQALPIEGDIFEAGVGSGGSGRLMLNLCLEAKVSKTLWLLDTFAGYRKVDAERDGSHVKVDQCKCENRDYVAALLQNKTMPVHLIEGLIPATLEQVKTSTIAFAHIDVNLYEPTRASTEFCLNRMPKGGVIVFDDYSWPSTIGARQAIDEVCAHFRQNIICLAESTQAFLIKS